MSDREQGEKFHAMLKAQERPLVESEADREALAALFRRPLPPQRRRLRPRPVAEPEEHT